MKNTPNVTPTSTNGAPKNDGAKVVAMPVPVPVSELIEKAKNGQKPYPTPAPEPEKAPEPVTSQTPEPTPERVVAPVAAVIAPAPEKPARSRAEQIAYWNEKAGKISLINNQLYNLRLKRDQLKDFSFDVDRNDDSRYAKLTIIDDNNHPFECRHHGLTSLVVEFLKEQFAQKIEEKETEFLAVAHE